MALPHPISARSTHSIPSKLSASAIVLELIPARRLLNLPRWRVDSVPHCHLEGGSANANSERPAMIATYWFASMA